MLNVKSKLVQSVRVAAIRTLDYCPVNLTERKISCLHSKMPGGNAMISH